MISVYFDSTLKTRKGRIPFYECSFVEEAKDNELAWFHEGYGLMKLYRLLKVDEKNYIAENLNKVMLTGDPRWREYSSNPSLAL